ncbi:amino acid ABC transporter substrate-binding protein [Limnoraphis robusta]|uniref:Amino acid ABC transporter substrate-binding protein n=1 Tax=Limnoraphis robusta CCNP1315 TaxID=3110306 RepID=A0ABU5TXU9_9CYAN|nr:amino acid ABC transporter substrate-binding protein [Limnoraphis robusta]MEA5519772.1 amino acid ABC transporter substrate-binding protein [Limnoraphis robusta CCNP1315]MEA5547526.1 amino acid ABC transporter substrate-binding protein [Limnoraphis robusta CCNP1324]
MNTKITISLFSLLLTVGFQLPSLAETVLEKVNRTGVLTVGVREDAIPFSYSNDSNNFEGYSVELMQLIHRRLEQELNKPIKLELKPVTLQNRFSSVESGNIDLVCGADSITAKREQTVEFSIPFFTTGIQLLVQQEDAERLDPTQTTEEVLEGLTPNEVSIAFIQGTTTEIDLKPMYPEASWQIIGSRTEGLRRLRNNEIDAIASDGILLIGEVLKQGEDIKMYRLIPQQPLSFENYGCIFPQNNLDWSNIINSTITSSENTDLWNQWFNAETGRFPYERFSDTANRSSLEPTQLRRALW